MNVFALQFNIAWEEKAANFATVRRLLKQAAPARGSLVALPEMFATGFSMNVDAVAETSGGPTEKFLSTTAREWEIWLIAGAAMRGKDGQVRNKALVFSPDGELAAFYAKMRPFTPGGEWHHYVPGKRPVPFQCGECTVAPFVCYDLRFPELFRIVARSERPEVFVVIANWPDKRIHHWTRLLMARAIENQAFVVGVNRIGSDPYYAYPGRSIIVDAQGEILADSGGAEGWAQAKLDLESLAQYRQGLPFLDDLDAHSFDFDPHRAMIGTENIGADKGALEARPE